jgi:hypothetical protein
MRMRRGEGGRRRDLFEMQPQHSRIKQIQNTALNMPARAADSTDAAEACRSCSTSGQSRRWKALALQVPLHAEANVVELFAQAAVGEELSHHDCCRHVALVLAHAALQNKHKHERGTRDTAAQGWAPGSCSGARP